MSNPHRARAAHDALTRLLSVAMVAIGVALAIRATVLSLLLGLLFFAAGVGRLYAQLQMRGRRGKE